MTTVLAFDTLKFAKRLKAASVPPEQAEAQAEALRDIMEVALQTAGLATKSDLEPIKKEIESIRKDLASVEQRLDAKIDALGQRLDEKIDTLEQRMDAKIGALEQRMDVKINALEQRMDAKIDALGNKLIIRLTGVLIIVMGAIQTIIALLPKLMHW